MVLVHNGFPAFILFAVYQTAARVGVGLTQAARRRSERRWLNSTSDLCHGEQRPSWGRQTAQRNLPGSVFDARYKGLTAYAGRLDAAICRQERLR
jgi:hypothetical protein